MASGLTQRVVNRWLCGQPSDRTAGLFEPPPAMFKKINAWVTEVLAAHYLYDVEAKISSLQGSADINAALARLEEYRADLPTLIDRLTKRGQAQFNKIN